MEESSQSESVATPITPPPQSPPQLRELSHFVKEKEPENQGTSTNIVKQEYTQDFFQPKDHATSSLDQSVLHHHIHTSPLIIYLF